jgi:hypothetical protein
MKPGGDAGLFVCKPVVLEGAMLKIFSIGGLTLLFAWTTAFGATPEPPGFTALNALLPAQPGNKACYVRSYDAVHLSAHPRQRIKAMKFLLSVGAYDPKPEKSEQPSDRFYYMFFMSVSRRADKRLLHTSGDCLAGAEISCVVDCDGGGVTLDKLPPAGSLIVRLKDDGIRMFHDCDEEQGILVKPGTDDKVFRLDKAANDACGALEDKEK